MGYTHYWTQEKRIAKPKLKKFIGEAQKILKASPCWLFYEMDQLDTPPICTTDFIRFNGKKGEGYETFYLGFNPKLIEENHFEFCKTALKAYDGTVTAILALLGDHFPDAFTIRSDGNESDWAEGIDLAERALNRRLKYPVND
jgi:hypothetical protein